MAYNIMRSFERSRSSTPPTPDRRDFEQLLLSSITEEDLKPYQPRSETQGPPFDRILAPHQRRRTSDSSVPILDNWFIKAGQAEGMADMRTTTSSRSQMPVGVRPTEVEAIKTPIDTCFVQLAKVKAYRAQKAPLLKETNVRILPDAVVFCRLWPNFFGPSGLKTVATNKESQIIFDCLRQANLIDANCVIARPFRGYGKPVIHFEEILASMEDALELELSDLACKRIHWALLTFHEFYHLTYQQFATIHNAYMPTDEEAAELQAIWRRFGSGPESAPKSQSFFSSLFSTSPSEPKMMPPAGNVPVPAITRYWHGEEYLKFDEDGNLSPFQEHLKYPDADGLTPFIRGGEYGPIYR